METIIITILVVAVLAIGLELYRAHKNHATFQQQSKTDLDKVKADAKAEVDALKGELAKVREHIAATTGTTVGTAPAAPVAPVAPAPAPAPSGTGQAPS